MCFARILVYLLFFSVFSRSAEAQSQSNTDSVKAYGQEHAVSGDDEWLSSVDRSWDPDYSQTWYDTWGPSEGNWTLSLVGGASFDNTSRLSSALVSSDSQTSAPIFGTMSPQHRGRFIYAMANLQLPLADLGSFWMRPLRDKNRTRAADAGGAKIETAWVAEETSEGRPAEVNPQPSQTTPSQTQPVDRQKLQIEAEMLTLVMELSKQVALAGQSQQALARLQSLIRRSRQAGLVPELRLRGVLGFDSTTSSQDVSAIVPGETSVRGGRDSLIEARLTFRLDRLVFGDQESGLERQRSDVVEQMQKRIGAARADLVKWLGASRKAVDDTLLPEEQAEAELDAVEALVELYALSDGWFQGRRTLFQLHLPELLRGVTPSGSTEKEPPAQNQPAPDDTGQDLPPAPQTAP